MKGKMPGFMVSNFHISIVLNIPLKAGGQLNMVDKVQLNFLKLKSL